MSSTAPAAPAAWTDPYDVIWDSPSTDASGSMPLGNGEVGINLWVERDGDLRFYISRSDSLSEVSRLLKVGEVRLSLKPNPFRSGAPFRQHLRLSDGICEITAGTGTGRVRLQLFVDSDFPVIHVIGNAASPLTISVTGGSWRTTPHTLAAGEEQNSAWSMHGAPFPLVESADVFPSTPPGAAAWYHRNERTVVPSTLEVQSLQTAAALVHDPLIHRTFGGWMTGSGLRGEGRSLHSTRPVKSFSLRVAAPCLQCAELRSWTDAAREAASKSRSSRAALLRTRAWWRSFWNRSHVVVKGDEGLPIPGAVHPMRIGFDSKGENRFPGTIGRTAVYGRAVSTQEMEDANFSTDYGFNHPPPGRQFSGSGAPHTIPPGKLELRRGFTLEAWIHPDRLQPGRIFDRLTAGRDDGFLFDTHPGSTLRVILGGITLSAPPGTLKSGQWQHAAATADAATGAVRIYQNGRMVAERAGDTGPSVTRGYALQRYMQACGGRGVYPIKFNGGIFTVEPKAMGKPFNADWRAWGDDHWWQNVRHMYHPMLAGGDIEMMAPLFRMYEAARPLAEARTALYHRASGAYFPETMTVWGTYSNGDYGWNRKGLQPKDVQCPYWQFAWNQGPELVALMLDRWDFTRDSHFLKSQLLPMAQSVLQYFDSRFRRDSDGRLVLDPTQSVETYWTGVINDMPTVAGLHNITQRLTSLPRALTTAEQRAFFAKMRAACPTLPVEQVQIDGKAVAKLAPAQKFDRRTSNCENPELYAVWPFRLFGIRKPGLAGARAAYEHRLNHLDVGWGYDGNVAAILGLTDEASRILKVKCANSNPAYRWPATWGPNFDWLPDQNHGGNLLETTQLMLLQSDGDRILLLPAWPRGWDVDFKLHAPRSTTVECRFHGGKIEELRVIPESRRKDVVLPAGL